MAIPRPGWSLAVPTATSTMKYIPDDADTTDEDDFNSSDDSIHSESQNIHNIENAPESRLGAATSIFTQSSTTLPSTELFVAGSQQITTGESIKEDCISGTDQPFMPLISDRMVTSLVTSWKRDKPSCGLGGSTFVGIARSIEVDDVVQSTEAVVIHEDALNTADYSDLELVFDADVTKKPLPKCSTKSNNKISVNGSSKDMPIVLDKTEQDNTDVPMRPPSTCSKQNKRKRSINCSLQDMPAISKEGQDYTNMSPPQIRSPRKKRQPTIRNFLDAEATWMTISFKYLSEVKDIAAEIRRVENEQAVVASILVKNQERISSLVLAAQRKLEETEDYIKCCEMKENQITKKWEKSG